MTDPAPTLLWLRRDLRLTDHPALVAAVERGGPVIPVHIRDGAVDALGAAPKWRLSKGLQSLSDALDEAGSRLILRAGPAREVLEELVAETGAEAVYWTRLYDPEAQERDARVKEALRDQGIEAKSFGGHLMFEPWTVETGQGSYYKVYSPFWRAVKDRAVEAPLPKPETLPAPATWPGSDRLEDWQLEAPLRRGAVVLEAHAPIGEQAAQGRLGHFMAQGVESYKSDRDRVDRDGTSMLSAHLSLGEISPHQCWHAGLRAQEAGKAGAETFLKELVWREFAYHLMYHTPHILTDNWRPEWDSFPWREDRRLKEVQAWEQGRTGEPFVDAALRQMYVTGTMHNRARMVVASYLTKHLMVHWRVGMKWFEDCLVDWDPASNAMGWQWVAGCGPDAAPYFRVFNPETQLHKFDPDGAYVRAWIAERSTQPPATACAYFNAIPEAWAMSPDAPYPDRLIALDSGRKRALDAYGARDKAS